MWQQNIRRQYHGYYSQAVVAGQFGFIGLYNDGAAGRIISVMDIRSNNNAALTASLRRLLLAKPIEVAGGVPLFAGDSGREGFLYAGSATPAPAMDALLGVAGVLGVGQSSRPLWCVPPGWGLEIWHTAVATLLALNFIWQVDDEEDFLEALPVSLDDRE